ncbi:porin [Pandoraea pnomenusa]|uniref:Outer membrane porin protein BP0840 n=1 Tax=Pandoraea pnomenusa TaxID=93220 RepID=A0A378YMI4_9BURK|nr:porin [Pandoraea pnomenusa]AHN76296.1 porin [Pandoraea pnomenusa]AIU27077.1 porin [Pandoraea pnomenusa]MBN9096306.1 porin [Pandoraea pnomenusa]QDH61503.1 porin [Pandoraea pnomenusa]SUA77988.1 Outer membrane porin protein BP0840 precursor [Pandoraea pnomenusa]
MKKSLLALGVLGAFAGAAHAQSSVTLYGIIDAGLQYVSKTGGNIAGTGNASKNFQFANGNLQGSRWGLKGAEDLGGGLKAIFVLESGFNLGNGTQGQNSRIFGRQAYVGLSSATAGTLTIGRQYDSVVDFVGPYASGSQWATFAGAHPFDNDNLNNSFRVNNAVKYTTVNYGGFSAGGMYGFSNSANNGSTGTGFANNRAYSFGLGYANGPVSFGAGYLYLGSPSSNSTGVINNSGDATTAMTAGGASDKAWIASVGGNYAFGPATVGLVYGHSVYQYIGGGSWKFDNVEANAKYMLTPALQLGASYTYTWSTLNALGTNVSPKYHQVNLGVDYFLSKRTDTYLVGLWQHANNDAPGGASLNGLGFSQSTNQFAVTAGIRHKF